ncbi:MAG: hypothetical protein KAQ96_11390, partial [Thermoplasmata archaeon]|nr:hypothetical protein [Thermoplasmata archaeon]
AEKHRLRMERLEEEAAYEPELAAAAAGDRVAGGHEVLTDVIDRLQEKTDGIEEAVSNLASAREVDELQDDLRTRMENLAKVTEELAKTKAEMEMTIGDLENKRRELEEAATVEPEPEPEEPKTSKKKKKKRTKKAGERLEAEGLEVQPEMMKKKTLKYLAYHRRLRDLEELPDDDVEALERLQEELALLKPEEILIPQDIYTFFTSPGGHSMLVRGQSKTGKTTLALQIVEEIAEVDELLYVPSRTSERRRHIQFPWLLEKEDEDRKLLGDKSRMEKFIKNVDSDKFDIKDVRQLLRRSPAPQEILNIYARVEQRMPLPIIIVFDRIDKLAERHRVDVGDLVEILHQDLADRGKAQLIFVQDQPRLRGLDARVDGSLVLKTFSEDEQEFTGHMEISKLLDLEVQQPRYFYKLRAGRFSFMKGVTSF